MEGLSGYRVKGGGIVLVLILVSGCGMFGMRNKGGTKGEGLESPEARQLLSEATQSIQDEDFREATNLLGRAKQWNANAPEIWTPYGIAASYLGEDQKARDAFRRALEIYEQRYQADPREPRYVKEQVYLLILLNRGEEAKDRLSRGLSNHPGSRVLNRLKRRLPKLLASDELPQVGRQP